MLVKNDLLFQDDNTQVPFAESKNSDPGLQARYIIIHYTAGSSAQAAIDTLRNDQVENRVSAHMVISRTGEVTQLVPFNRAAWHAGVSYWENERDINRIAIGIELDNEGWYRQEDGIWVSSFDTPGQEEDLEILTHPKHNSPLGWRKFPSVQRQTALEVCRALRVAYTDIVEVLGHEDIHEDKTDPGPAFRLDEFRAELFPERVHPQEEATTPEAKMALAAKVKEYQTIGTTPIYANECRDEKNAIVRYGPPPVVLARHPDSPLKKGTGVKVEDTIKDKESGVKWDRVKVKKSNASGFVKAELVKSKSLIRDSAELFIDTGSIPKHETPLHEARSLPAGTRVRRLETRKNFVLVCTLDKIPKHGYVYAWLRESDIRPI